MTSAPGVPLGWQRPSLRDHHPDLSLTSGPLVAEYASEFGLLLDDWQRYSLDCQCAEDPDGTWLSFEFAEIVTRQNGKGSIIEARELAQCNVLNVDRNGNQVPQLLVHTAHELPTLEGAFDRMVQLIDQAPPRIRRTALPPLRGNGRWSIRWRNGSQIKYRGRSGASGRGLSGDVVVLDEAMKKLEPRMMGALVPIMATRPNPQILYFGSAPLEESDQLRDLQERADSGDPNLCLLEWGNKSAPDLDDVEAIARANPALGIRIPLSYVLKERSALPETEYLRERLGVADQPEGARVIQQAMWDALAVEGAGVEKIDPVCLAFDVSPQQEWASVAAVGRRSDGRWQGEIWNAQPGDDWLVEEIVSATTSRTVCRVVADPKSPAWALVPALAQRGVEVHKINGNELAAACSGLMTDVTAPEPRWAHLGQPVLDAAVAAARKRNLDAGWAWARKDTTADITPLVAVTLARHGFEQALADGWTEEVTESFAFYE